MPFKIYKIVKFNIPSSKKKWRIGIIQKIVGTNLYNVKEAAGRMWQAVPGDCIKSISLIEVGRMMEVIKESSETSKTSV
jgi:hypothetical protein